MAPLQLADGCASGAGLYAALDGRLATSPDDQGGLGVDRAGRTRRWRACALWRSLTTTQMGGHGASRASSSALAPNSAGVPRSTSAACRPRGARRSGTPGRAVRRRQSAEHPERPGRGERGSAACDVQRHRVAHLLGHTGGPPLIAARIHRLAMVLRDDSPAHAAQPARRVADGRWGPCPASRAISFSAADKGSGIRYAELELDGGPHTRDEGVRLRTAVRPPGNRASSPTAGTLTLRHGGAA